MLVDREASPSQLQQLLGTFTAEQCRRLRTARIALAGQGNIGTWLAHFIVPHVGFARIIDRDRIERRNALNQCYDLSAVGQPKATALADALRRRCPGVEIMANVADLEDAPLGWFAGVDLVLAGLHSLRGRQRLISEIAWPLGVPVIDGAVGEGWLGAVRVLVPGAHRACLECAWSPSHYRQLAQEFPCFPNTDADAPPTRSPAFLGASVASLMAAQCIRLLVEEGEQQESGTDASNEEERRSDPSRASRLTEFDLSQGRMIVSRLRRAARCRYDHEVIGQQLALQVRFDAATVADVVATVEEHWPHTAVQVETRRLRWAASEPPRRYFDLGELQAQPARRLGDLGLTADDALRLRAAGEAASTLLWLDRKVPSMRAKLRTRRQP